MDKHADTALAAIAGVVGGLTVGGGIDKYVSMSERWEPRVVLIAMALGGVAGAAIGRTGVFERPADPPSAEQPVATEQITAS